MNLIEKCPGLCDTVHAVQTGAAQPQNLIDTNHARAITLEPHLHAFTHLPTKPPTIATKRGSLAGVTVGVKDLIDTADMPTTYGSPIYSDHRPNEDAWVVARLKELSATILGKTVTTEFAWLEPGPTRNPWHLNHTPGGSSSGSVAAVASGSVQAALGTQTLGSILRPASFCGIVGLKPSFGTISTTGVHALSQSLDHLGIFTRNVDDAAYLLMLLAGGPGSVRYPKFEAPPEGLDPSPAPRIAWLQPTNGSALQESQSALLAEIAARFTKAGAIVKSFALPAAFDELPGLAMTLCEAEGAANFADLVTRFPDKTSPRLKKLVERGVAISATDYLAARSRQLALRAEFTNTLSDFDVVLTTAATGEAPEGLSETGDPSLCTPWTTLGVPAITLPAGIGPQGLPLGIQLVAPFGVNFELLKIAKWCEQVIRWPNLPS
jgi:Asp-tRNA(Asn)/Glu-tRNA(Gln) amidotransferase A subunit family amidase